MPILVASELPFSPPLRCATCGVALLPYGRSEPFAVDAAGAPYCRRDGAAVEPTYAARHAEWERQLNGSRLAAVHALQEEPESARLAGE